jgi:hypothetical protein
MDEIINFIRESDLEFYIKESLIHDATNDLIVFFKTFVIYCNNVFYIGTLFKYIFITLKTQVTNEIIRIMIDNERGTQFYKIR